MNAQLYDGPVCFIDGWHYTVVKDDVVDEEHPDGHDVPGERLFSFGDGTYRLANDDDASHHDQYHERFATVEMSDGGPGIRVTEEELALISEVLRQKREGEG